MINGKSSYMTDAKVARLDALGFVWTLRESVSCNIVCATICAIISVLTRKCLATRQKKPWEEWLSELRAYKAVHGNLGKQ
jgi:hypothetical protein